MIGKKLWYMITFVALMMLPLAGCSGGGASTTSQNGTPVTFSGKVADVGKSSLKTLFAAAPDLGTLSIVDAQDGTALGSGAIDATGAFKNIAITLPNVKTVLVFKATVSLAGSPFRTIVPLDLSTPPAAGISASNNVNIVISQDSTNVATAVSAMLGVTGILGDTGATLASVSKTFTDAATQVMNNGGQVLAYNTTGLALTGSLSSAALLPATPAGTLTFNDLNDIKLDAKIVSAFIPGKNPIVNFEVTNKATGKGISGLKTFGLHIAKLIPEANGSTSYWVNYIDKGIAALPNQTAPSKPGADPGTTFKADGSVNVKGYTIIDHGDGSYTAIFASDVTSNTNVDGVHGFDATALHRVGLTVTTVAVPGVTATGPINPVTNLAVATISPVNRLALVYDFTPSTGAALVDASSKQSFARDIVTNDGCIDCHNSLSTIPNPANGALLGHTQRPNVRLCVICHTNSNTSGEGEFVTFIHRIHMGEKLNDVVSSNKSFKPIAKGLVTYGEHTYPQDIRNCTKCHKGGADSDNWKTKASAKNCVSCHNALDLTKHYGGQTDDKFCAGCHTGASAIKEVAANHVTTDLTPNNPILPAGVANFTYAIAPDVTDPVTKAVVSSGVTLNASKQPVIRFQIKKDGVLVTALAIPTLVTNAVTGLQVIDPNYEPIPGFTAGPSFYVVYSVPQDGITAPADFNARSNVALANLLIASGSPKQGTVTGPDAAGYFEATLTGDTIGQAKPAAPFTGNAIAVSPIVVPASAKLLTGAIIGTFTQKNAPGYPYTAANVLVSPNTSASGGLVRRSLAVQKVATGFTGRRAIVDNAKCNKCHEQLGAVPNFHGGARNDATLCAFCHTANGSNSGWSYNASTFVHGIHASKKRSVAYTFAAASATDNFSKVTYPGYLRNCEQCHVTGSYDMSATASTSAVPSLLWTTVAAGKYNSASATAYRLSPYVIQDNLYDYGTSFSYVPATDVTNAAAATTLVSSPISAACFSCHDTAGNKAHFVSMGGSIYEARSTALAKSETCLTCHGTAANTLNATVPTIKAVHRWW
jgi:OmcA/MtrC family decaheme c-type cytochrome